MKLNDLSNTDLVSLCIGAEKTIDYLAKHIRVKNATQTEGINELNMKYIKIRDKYDEILNEINNRIINLE